jgi:hypothetical protein
MGKVAHFHFILWAAVKQTSHTKLLGWKQLQHLYNKRLTKSPMERGFL